MGLRLTVPADWDIVRHSTRPERGSLSLVDRRQQRLQLRWRDVERAPDLGQMIADHRSRQLQRDPDARFRPFEPVGSWRGLSRIVDRGELVTRALRFDEPTGRLIEAIVLDPGDGSGPDLRELLTGIAVLSRAREAARWRAFDLEVHAPPGWRLDTVQVNPADASLRFKPASKDGRKQRSAAGMEVAGPELVVRRMGMASSWYKGPEALLRKALGRDVDFEMAAAHHPPHNAVRAISDEQGTRLRRYAGRLRRREDVIWQCQRENAVYQLTRMSAPPRGPGARQAPAALPEVDGGIPMATPVAGEGGFRVGCCGRREEPGRWLNG